jgi:hydroxylamine reductase (hybrid-cluster protein)
MKSFDIEEKFCKFFCEVCVITCAQSIIVVALFRARGIDGIISKKHSHSAQKITDYIERKIVHIASSTNPRKHGVGFSTWSLRVLAGYLMEKKIVKSISHSEIRNVLLKYNVRWRHLKKDYAWWK